MRDYCILSKSLTLTLEQLLIYDKVLQCSRRSFKLGNCFFNTTWPSLKPSFLCQCSSHEYIKAVGPCRAASNPSSRLTCFKAVSTTGRSGAARKLIPESCLLHLVWYADPLTSILSVRFSFLLLLPFLTFPLVVRFLMPAQHSDEMHCPVVLVELVSKSKPLISNSCDTIHYDISALYKLRQKHTYCNIYIERVRAGLSSRHNAWRQLEEPQLYPWVIVMKFFAVCHSGNDFCPHYHQNDSDLQSHLSHAISQ